MDAGAGRSVRKRFAGIATKVEFTVLGLLDRGHDGDHAFVPWEGCVVRVPFGEGTVPFHGFAG